ncbi:D-inositol-3-phosphate glycosyltransferase [compost metagenome]
MIEAMAAGTPVVGTRKGSVPEVVEDGVTGVLVDDPGDLDALVKATKAALDLDARACRARVERLFSADKMVEDYLAVYERVLAGSPRAASPNMA